MPIAFVGVTLEGTPQIVTPSGVAGLRFGDEADAINRLVPRLRRRGVQTIVALVHEGGFPSGKYNACPGISGPITDIVRRTSREVDVFITGHTHQAYNCVLDGRRVTSAASFGRLVTDIDLRIDGRTGETRRVRARNRIVTRRVGDDRSETRLVRRYVRLARPVANRVIGRAAAPITREATPAGESALGDVIADGQLAATSGTGVGGAQIAVMNPGGIRADLAAGDVTYNEAFTVQPFGNSLVTMTLTGAQIEQLLEQQVWPTAADEGTVLQVSAGFRYAWSAARPAGDRVDPASITLGGVPVSPTGRYRVTVNSFLADGGDGFTVLRAGHRPARRRRRPRRLRGVLPRALAGGAGGEGPDREDGLIGGPSLRADGTGTAPDGPRSARRRPPAHEPAARRRRGRSPRRRSPSARPGRWPAWSTRARSSRRSRPSSRSAPRAVRPHAGRSSSCSALPWASPSPT